MKVKLEDLLPEKPEFFLASCDRAFTLRIPNMADKTWLKNHYPDHEAMRKMFNEQDWPEVVKIIYYHLNQEDRMQFPATVATITNEEGDSIQRRLSGPEHLLTCIGGLEEATKMLQAFVKAMMLSEPILEETLKKSLTEMLKSIGEKSLTPSTQNMAGQKKKSAR